MKNELIIPSVGTRLATQNATRAELAIVSQCRQDTLHDLCRVQLAHSALEHTMLLSALEAEAYRIAPFGEHRYKQIVDTYALGAARDIYDF